MVFYLRRFKDLGHVTPYLSNIILLLWSYQSFWGYLIIDCVVLKISYHLYYLRISKVLSKLHHGKWGKFTVKNATLYLHILIIGIFSGFFHQKICVFTIFISFFDKVSNFRSRILTDQKPEKVIRNCQWNCMYIFSDNLLEVVCYQNVFKDALLKFNTPLF